ncbi:MAG: ATP-binding protein [Clostridiales bacterium]|nr:ATP-binding protein [Clostridiales bacterium]MCC8065638.1 ATP-binding protein [Clostridiales bacterium]
MGRVFNVTGACSPARHYMVDFEPRLVQIKSMIAAGDYFSINRARQYGKTTTLRALAEYLKDEYVVISLDFQKMTTKDFSSESNFVRGLAREINKVLKRLSAVPDEPADRLRQMSLDREDTFGLTEIFDCFSDWCGLSDKPIVLLIDEVDTASNNQVFLDFLALLRAYYLDRDVTPTFQSVILAGLYDVRNVKRKIRPDEEHKQNSPWNIAADFNIEMGFSSAEIAGMLGEYEADYHTGMNIGKMADSIYAYTSGYPYLVSRLCKFMDEKIAGSENYPDKSSAWTNGGFQEAVKLILNETNTLYQSLIGKVREYPALKSVLYDLLFTGKQSQYNGLNEFIEIAAMFGFVKNSDGFVEISNRIFETVLYNWFISEESINNQFYKIGAQEKNKFITGGHLNVRLVLERFVMSFHDLYAEQDDEFLEDVGRRYFLLYLKPIINGTGNYYVEARTRNQKRTDLIIDYRGEQFVIELKIWHGNAYNQRGESQLMEYLDYFHLKKGYMLSFNFNQKKQIGIKDISLGEKVLVEAVV